jgi:hypothetical protein
MTARYVVVQYVPDMVADERINVGVIVLAKGTVRLRFLRNWERVRHFAAGRDISFLQGLAGRLGGLDAPALLKMARRWAGCVRLTCPRASLLSPDDLLERAAGWFLGDASRPPERAGRHAAAAAGRNGTTASHRPPPAGSAGRRRTQPGTSR